jgi:hypothetical protein
MAAKKKTTNPASSFDHPDSSVTDDRSVVPGKNSSDLQSKLKLLEQESDRLFKELTEKKAAREKAAPLENLMTRMDSLRSEVDASGHDVEKHKVLLDRIRDNFQESEALLEQMLGRILTMESTLSKNKNSGSAAPTADRLASSGSAANSKKTTVSKKKAAGKNKPTLNNEDNQKPATPHISKAGTGKANASETGTIADVQLQTEVIQNNNPVDAETRRAMASELQSMLDQIQSMRKKREELEKTLNLQ